MPVSELTPLPPAPSIADPTNFEAEADALLGALPVMVTELNAAFGAINDTEEDLADLVANAGYSGTSSTSLTVGTGSKALTTQANRSYVPGVFVLVADSANPVTNFMIGVVTAYNPTTGALTFTSVLAGGSGTIASWLVSLSGKPGTDATVTFGEGHRSRHSGGRLDLRHANRCGHHRREHGERAELQRHLGRQPHSGRSH
jgi:hypothetical protein